MFNSPDPSNFFGHHIFYLQRTASNILYKLPAMLKLILKNIFVNAIKQA